MDGDSFTILGFSDIGGFFSDIHWPPLTAGLAWEIRSLPNTMVVIVGTDSDGDRLTDELELAYCTDPDNPDSDGDRIPDGIEEKSRNGQVDPGETDPCDSDTDDDGVPDGVEDSNYNGTVDFWETDPTDGSSLPAVILHLKKGFNLVALHVSGELGDWLPAVGNRLQVEQVSAYDEVSGTWVTLIPEDAANPAFTLQGSEGLMVRASEDRTIGLAAVACPAVDFTAGFNLVAFGCPGEAVTAYQLLQAIGSQNVVSIQRYSAGKGAFETAAIDENGERIGMDFALVPGEGYIIFMKQAVLDFIP
jgi:hypothetical protein